ncbi:MAG: phosphoribosylanthranilate isomerase [Candidatus Bathyarchaeia archaeon]
MRTVRVKICGITNEWNLEMVCDAGADVVGFIVCIHSSPRNLSPRIAKDLIERVPIFVKSCLVVVPKSVGEIIELYEELRPDIIQIHGDCPLDVSILKEKAPYALLIRAMGVGPGEKWMTAEGVKPFDAVLVDSYSPGRFGGTGMIHDWRISRSIRERIAKPLILACGLSTGNVEEAIRIVKPYAVDVSTGVESEPGRKDPEKVEAFVRRAKGVDLADC